LTNQDVFVSAWGHSPWPRIQDQQQGVPPTHKISPQAK